MTNEFLFMIKERHGENHYVEMKKMWDVADNIKKTREREGKENVGEDKIGLLNCSQWKKQWKDS